MQHVREIFSVIGVPVDFEIVNIDSNKEGNDDLDYAIISIKRNGVALKGNIETRSEGTVLCLLLIKKKIGILICYVLCRYRYNFP